MHDQPRAKALLKTCRGTNQLLLQMLDMKLYLSFQSLLRISLV